MITGFTIFAGITGPPSNQIPYMLPSLSTELLECQRYFQFYGIFDSFWCGDGNEYDRTWPLHPLMRVSPTVTGSVTQVGVPPLGGYPKFSSSGQYIIAGTASATSGSATLEGSLTLNARL
jgi:hypothetical protein